MKIENHIKKDKSIGECLMCIKEKETVDKCLSKWGEDPNTIELPNKTAQWLSGIKSNDKEIYLRLLSEFNYYSREKICEIFKSLHQELLTKTKQKFDETIFVPIISPEGGRFNHSYEMVLCYREANRIPKIQCPFELDQIIAQYPLDTGEIKNVVFLDDMLGTGKTVKDAFIFMFRYYNKLFENKNIYLTVIEAMPEGIERIKELKTEIGLGIELLKWNVLQKAFTPEYILTVLKYTQRR